MLTGEARSASAAAGPSFPCSLGPTRVGVSGRRPSAGRGRDSAAAGSGGGAGAWRRRVGLGGALFRVVAPGVVAAATGGARRPPFGGWLMQMQGAPLLAAWAADRRRAWLAPGASPFALGANLAMVLPLGGMDWGKPLGYSLRPRCRRRSGVVPLLEGGFAIPPRPPFLVPGESPKSWDWVVTALRRHFSS